MRSASQTHHNANDIAMCPISEKKVNAALDSLYQISAITRICRVAIDAACDDFNLPNDVKKELFDVNLALQLAGSLAHNTTEFVDEEVRGNREVKQ